MNTTVECTKCFNQQVTEDSTFSGYLMCEQCGCERLFTACEEEVKPIREKQTLDFVHLHVHSEFSLLDGLGRADEFIQQALLNGQKAIAITDHGNTSGHFKWFKSCTKAGIKPILGCELYVTDSIQAHGRYWHITVLAKTLEGLRNLYKLVSIANTKGYYYKPRVDWDLLKQHSEGLIATTGCSGSKVGWMIGNDFPDKDIITEIKRQKSIFKDFYLELSPWEHSEGKLVARKLHSLIPKLKLPVIITRDAHYPSLEMSNLHDVMLCVQTNAKFDDPARMKFSSSNYFICTGDEIRNQWKELHPDLQWSDEWCLNTVRISDQINFQFPKADPISFPYSGDKKKLLRSMVEKGMKRLQLTKSQPHKDRLKYELGLIEEKGFADYFLVVSDMVQWAKSNGIFVGPARGSSCGSLVCYALDITTIDPLKYDLLFERFIDLNRTDLPDIDIDFEDDRRHEVKKYLESKYGSDHVASLSTFGTFKGRLCIQDIGRVFKIPVQVTDELKTLVVKRSGGDSRFGSTIEDTFDSFDKARHIIKKYPMLEFAKEMEGRIRHKGIHAAGVIISSQPITDFASLYRGDDGNSVLSLDYDDAAEIGLLKIDVLGLTAMSVLKDCLSMVKKSTGKVINLLEIPLDDEKTFQSFCDLRLFGVFQFDGLSLFTVTRNVQPRTFRELCDINALSRPGTLHGGGTDSYVDRKNGKEKVEYLHPLIEKLTNQTYGITIYQEQVMMVVREIGNFSWKDTSTIRKIMAKNVGAESFDKYRASFIDGASKNGVSHKVAEKIWNSIYTFGSWAFNKSHSVAYAHIAYWMMYLKVHHPTEFYCAMLRKEQDEEKQRRIVKEFVNNGGTIHLPSLNVSDAGLKIHNGGLLLGIGNIKGIGQKAAIKASTNKPFRSTQELLKAVGESAYKKFRNLGMLDEIGREYQNELFNPDEVESQKVKHQRQDALKAALSLYPRESRLPKAREWWLKTFKQKPITISDLDHIEGKDNQVTIIGHTDPNKRFRPGNKMTESISSGKEFDAGGKPASFYDFLLFTLEDDTAFLTIRVHHKLYPKLKEMLWAIGPEDYVAVKGKYTVGITMLFATDVINITQQYSKKGNK